MNQTTPTAAFIHPGINTLRWEWSGSRDYPGKGIIHERSLPYSDFRLCIEHYVTKYNNVTSWRQGPAGHAHIYIIRVPLTLTMMAKCTREAELGSDKSELPQ